VAELNSLRAKTHAFDTFTLQPGGANPLASVTAELVELRAEFEPGSAETQFNLRGAVITYNAQKQELIVNDHRAAAPLRRGKQRLVVYCDRTGLEIFASDGLTYVPLPFAPKVDHHSLGIQAQGGNVKFTALQVHELKSAWKP
jgi:fructan beta-fructosidase